MTEGERFMAEIPMGQVFYTKICPDGVDGPVVESRVIYREERWGIRYIAVDAGTYEYKLEHAANWLGRLRFWFRSASLRIWKTQ